MSTSLCFYWYEIKAGEKFNRCWGQITWAIERLTFVVGELELTSVSDATDFDEMDQRGHPRRNLRF